MQLKKNYQEKNTHKYFSFKSPENDVFSIYQILFPWKKLQNRKYVSVKEIVTRSSTYLKYVKKKLSVFLAEKKNIILNKSAYITVVFVGNVFGI